MCKFYLAAKYDKRQELLPIAAMLMLHGHQVTSKWLNGSHDGTLPHERETYAKADFAHIDDCTHFVLFNLPIGFAEQSSGRNVEFGYAYAKQKVIIVVGEENCIFYTLADKQFETVKDFLDNYVPVVPV